MQIKKVSVSNLVDSGRSTISTHVSPPIPHPAHQHCQFPVNQAERYALLQSANFLFMLFAVPKFSEMFLQLGDVDYDCTNGIGNLSHTTHSFRNQGYEKQEGR